MMKRILAFLLACMMLLALCACGGSPAQEDTAANDSAQATAEPTAEATTEPTPTPTPTPTPAPVYVNPLNGEILDAPYTGRVFASTVCNTPNAVPHISLNEADIVFEMFVNSGIIRDLALYSDIRDVEVFGSVRSTRLMFHQIISRYDAILIHSGGAAQPLNDIRNKGLDNFNIDMWTVQQAGTSYRDTEHGRSYEATLFGYGQGCYDYAVSQGMRTEQPAGMDYGLTFADDGTPADGEGANTIDISFRYNGGDKFTRMQYNPETNKYVYHQYDQEMRDLFTGEQEAFTNVIVMYADIYTDGIYQVARYEKGGEGWFACGGKLIPIKWTSADDKSPIVFTKADGTQLDLGRGNTYIAIAPVKDSVVTWTE